MAPTFALISRFMSIDVPYLAEWFEYYDKLGITHYYLYYIDAFYINLEKALTYFPKDKVTIRLFSQNCIQDLNTIHRVYPYKIEEDFVLHVDSDEFLYLGKGVSLPQFIEAHNEIDYFYFQWLMAPSKQEFIECLNDILKDSTSPKYLLSMTKSMARTSKITFSNDTHSFDYNPQTTKTLRTSPTETFIIHFSYRGLYDCYNKLYHQRLLNHQPNNFLTSPTIRSMYYHDIPSRVACFLGEVDNANPKINTQLDLGIQSRTNVELLKLFEYKQLDTFIKRVKKLLNERIYARTILGPYPKTQMRMMLMNNRKPIDFTK